MPTEMLEKLLLDCKILSRELDVEGALITKHRKKEVIYHIFQGDSKFIHKKEECM